MGYGEKVKKWFFDEDGDGEEFMYRNGIVVSKEDLVTIECEAVKSSVRTTA